MLVATIPTNPVLYRPTATRAGHTLALLPTAWGLCGIAWAHADVADAPDFAHRPSEALLSRILTPGLAPAILHNTLMKLYPGCSEALGDGHGNFHPEVVPDWFPELARFLQGYYAATRREGVLPGCHENWTFWKSRLDWSQVTPFRCQVLDVLATVPSGMTLTYGQVAARIGKPSASRAVGAAIGRNPWPVLVPCHRVVGSTGKLTGFSAPGGVETKRRMLAMENNDSI